MNIDEAREQLIDLLYGELPEPRRTDLLRMVEANPELREELRQLRGARAALARTRVGEPTAPPMLHTRRRWPVRMIWWAAPITAAAGIIAVLLLSLAVTPPTRPVVAQGAVEIKRTEISLTILSEPEEQGAQPMLMRQTQMKQQLVYANGPAYSHAPPVRGWSGLAVVRDQRIIRNLPKGATEVRFTDVPAAIIPESVRLRSIDDPDRLAILEQNYQYDLASAGRILDRYIDKPITVLSLEGAETAGTLLAFNDESFTILPKGDGPRTISREKLRAVRFGELPKGLLTRPTLVWTVDNQAPINQRLEVAYLTGGLSWRADYVLRIRPGAKDDSGAGTKTQVSSAASTLADTREGLVRNKANSEPNSLNPQIFDSAELVGYATVNNFSGVAYENAQLKLMAGDVHLIQENARELQVDLQGGARRMDKEEKGGGFEEKSFFEYHLYTLGHETTLASAETKQIELVSAEGIRMSRAYVYDRTENPTAARVVSEFKNSKENGRGLGKPLPKGVIRLYAPDPSGEETYVAQTTIDHTPKDERVRLPWGYAFDIACSARQTSAPVRGPSGSQTWRYSLRNHKDYDVTVTVIVRVPRASTTAECILAGPGGAAAAATSPAARHPWHVREVGIVEIEVPVKAGASATADFSFSYDNDRGGGLKSPWEQ